MRFTVTSAPGVDDKLAGFWNSASDRQHLTIASNQIDAVLRQAPLSQGIAVDNYRVLRVGPLAVLYAVSEPNCLVTILDYVYHG